MSIGQPVARVEGKLKVTGAARYTADLAHEGEELVHAVAVCATIARGRIASIDTSDAMKADGVLLVVTHHNAPRLRPVLGVEYFGNAGDPVLALQDDRVHFAGQPVAVVVGDTLERATYAASLVRLGYEEEAAVATLYDRIDEAFDSRNAPPDVVGDVDSGLASAAVVVDQTYTTQKQHPLPMETVATTVRWAADEVTVYDTTQTIGQVRAGLATAFGLREEQVRVICEFVGGGFGGKVALWWPTIVTAMAAKLTGRLVRLVTTRRQMFGATGQRSHATQRVRLGAGRDGVLTAITHDSFNETSPSVSEPGFFVGAGTPMPYRCPNIRVIQKFVRVNAQPSTPMRAPVEGVGLVAVESAMDELAAELGIDPLELRRRNFAEHDPHTGKPWSSNGLLECYEQGAERFGWSMRDPRPRSMREGGELIGWGMATGIRFAGSQSAQARARIDADGSAVVQIGSQDIGTGTYTIVTQAAAEALGLPPHRMRAELGDTNLPPAGPSLGSFTAASVVPAAQRAGAALRDKMIAIAVTDEASPLFGLAAGELLVDDGYVSLKGKPSRGEHYTRILRRNSLAFIEATGQYTAPPPGQRPVTLQAFGVDFTEVRVDPDLGTIRVSRHVKALDVGRIVNPRTARSQVIGGVVFGMGQALTEATEVDRRNGRISNASMWGYHVPVNADVPDIDVIFVEKEDPHLPAGIKGLGEISTIGTAPAIANAVFHATGRRIRELPITADKLL